MINGKDKVEKFDAKSDEGIFLRYSLSNKAYRVVNRRILVTEEFIHVVFDETNIFKSKEVDLNDDTGSLEKDIKDMSLKSPPLQMEEDKEKNEENEAEKMEELPSLNK